MKPDVSHIKQIKVVSNTHWDREFRKSFEKTRRRLMTMMDVTLDILEGDPGFPSFTMDGHSIMIDDYLEMRPERRRQVEDFIREGRLIIGPWYTLPETLSIAQEALVRNFVWGRRRMEAYGAKPGTVAYTPASWGQAGQIPQIMNGFGLSKMMFYRGMSHHESDAEFIWEGPDGSRLVCSRFAVYARYNWYYQVHRAVTRERVFEKDYQWGEYDEVPLRIADGFGGEDLAFDLKDPSVDYDKSRLKEAIEDMVEREGRHFTTEVFLAMNGHDISVAWPRESDVIRDAREIFKGKYDIEHTDLEAYWKEMEKHLSMEELTVLKGERRAHLVKGMWTYLFPASISARTYLKLQDFEASRALVYTAEPLAALASAAGMEYPRRYVDRGWAFLLENHTHDANGGCAPDAVCLDMEYRYRKTVDVADIVTEDAMAHIARNLSPADQAPSVMQLIVFNPLPYDRDIIAPVDIEMPRETKAKSVVLESNGDTVNGYQPISWERSSSFVDSIWDVPTILDSDRLRFYAHFRRLPALGYRAYTVKARAHELRSPKTLVTGPDTMENDYIRVFVNGNGTLSVLNKNTGMVYEDLNYLVDQGESGNAWRHVAPTQDRIYTSLGVTAVISIVESGPLVSRIAAEYDFPVPEDYADGQSRSSRLVNLPVRIIYTLRKGSPRIDIELQVDNRAKDHWLRAGFPTGLETDHTSADSHLDVVDRPTEQPDSTGWVERFEPTHPLRTFVSMSDGQDGLAVFSKGLFEFEGRNDEKSTMLLTLIRSCRIKLAVSEEKQTELSDQGVQCPGPHTFHYAVYIHEGDWKAAELPRLADEYHTPVRIAQSGRGKGALPGEKSLLMVSGSNVQVAAMKQAEDGNGLILRLYNPTESPQELKIGFGFDVASIEQVRMDETEGKPVAVDGGMIRDKMAAKEIRTYRVQLGNVE